MNDASEKMLLEAVVGSMKRSESMIATLELIVLKREDSLYRRDKQIAAYQRLVDQMLREKNGAIAVRPQFEDLEDLPPNNKSAKPQQSPEQSGGRDALVAAQRRRKNLKEQHGRDASIAEAARPR